MFKKLNEIRQGAFSIYVDGETVLAEPGESVAAVLLRQDSAWSRTTPVSGAKRAPYCMMGVCFECLAIVDGASVQSCLVPVKDGMRVQRQLGRRNITS